MNPKIRAWLLFLVAVTAAIKPQLVEMESWGQLFTPAHFSNLLVAIGGVVVAWLSDRPAVAAARQDLINFFGRPNTGVTGPPKL